MKKNWTKNVQGIEHDAGHWYITKNNNTLFRVPLSVRLDGDLRPPDVQSRDDLDRMSGQKSYKHFGDLSVYGGYVLIPTEYEGKGDPHLTIFRADSSLEFVSAVPFPDQTSSSGVGQAGWVAVDSEGRIYSSVKHTTHLLRYTADWDAVGTPAFQLSNPKEIPLRTRDGAPMHLGHFQGGAISPTDRILYLTNGWRCDRGDRQSPINPGLHAFDLTTGREVARSSNDKNSLFSYKWECSDHWEGEEPQGLTIWERDGVPNAQNIRGQLHVLLLKNEVGNDGIWLKNYASNIYVDAASQHGDGTIDSPYPSLCHALGLAWSGSTIYLSGGEYYPTTIRTPGVRLHAYDSTLAVVGTRR